MEQNYAVLDFAGLLSKAARGYLLGDFENGDEMVFEIRKRKGVENFYALLDQDLRRQKIFRIHSFRKVKEGLVAMPRPASLAIKVSELLHIISELEGKKIIVQSCKNKSQYFTFHDFAEGNYELLERSWQVVEASLEVFNYMIQFPERVRGQSSRLISHGQSTKLLGREAILLAMFRFYKSDPLLTWDRLFEEYQITDNGSEFRFFSDRAIWKGQEIGGGFHGVLREDSVKFWSFLMKGTLIIENFESFMDFSAQAKEHLLIWGSGWRAVQLNRMWDVLPKPVYYWGDIDKEGIEIFFSLSQKVPHPPLPFLMDAQTFTAFRDLLQKVPSSNPSPSITDSDFSLKDFYIEICKNGHRIEQEQLHGAWELFCRRYAVPF